MVHSTHFKISLFICLIVHISATKTTSSIDEPKLITKSITITAYEDQTVVLPCKVLNLPSKLNIIWQYNEEDRSDHKKQTLLTIGKTLISNNYRVRVINNESTSLTAEAIKNQLSSRLSLEDYLKITTNNLEIRKLQSSDSGWYECQLPTKPTQKSYIFLQVHGVPKIHVNQRIFNRGDKFDITCHVKNLPKNSTHLYWTYNDIRIVPSTIIDNYAFKNSIQNKDGRFIKMLHTQRHHSKHGKRHKKMHRRNFMTRMSRKGHYIVFNNEKFNMTRLRINGLKDFHKGVYKCHYDNVQTEYRLDFYSTDYHQEHLTNEIIIDNGSVLKTAKTSMNLIILTTIILTLFY